MDHYKIFGVFLIFLGFSAASDIDEIFNSSCYADDPKISSCIKDLLTEVQPFFLEGIPEIGLEPLDPVFVPEIQLDNVTGLFEISGNFKDVTIRGLGNLTVLDVQSDLKKSKIIVKVFAPELELEGLTSGSGRLIILPYTIDGLFSSVFYNVTGVYKIKFTTIEENGEKYLRLKNSALDFKVKNGKFLIKDKKNKAIGKIMTRILNQNVLAFVNELKRPLAKVFAGIFDNAFDKFFGSKPVNEIFL